MSCKSLILGIRGGGGRVVVPIDAATADSACGFEPADPVTAEKVYERRWALTLIGRGVIKKLADAISRGVVDCHP